MSVWNKILAVTAAVALFSAPSFADGVQGAKVNRGPAPLQAHKMTPPEPGCVLVEGNKWACPVPPARFTGPSKTTYRAAPAPAPVTRTYSTTSTQRYAPAPTTRTYTTTSTYTSAPVTRTVTRSAPTTSTTRRVVTSSAAPAPQGLSLDIAAFDGGVGNGVDGNVYGGGGAVFFGGDQRFSGVLSHPASAFTFQRRTTGKRRGGGGGGHNPPKAGPCGCH